jgi:pimeloyl-ACP methyl ester carboxylesterase
MEYTIHKSQEYSYIDEGAGQPMLLLHGLFGALSNWQDVIEQYKKNYRVIIPMLPIYTMPILKTSVSGLAKYVQNFVEHKADIHNPILIGNSLGGHVALMYALDNPTAYKALVLTGSSGLYENSFGGSYPRRGDYDYIKQKAQLTFYDPNDLSDELMDELFEIVNNRENLIRVLAMSKSAIRHNLANELHKITQPTLLVWGNQDIVTPPSVGADFEKLIPNAQLHYIDKCGHAPMMEQPAQFNEILDRFLQQILEGKLQ